MLQLLLLTLLALFIWYITLAASSEIVCIGWVGGGGDTLVSNEHKLSHMCVSLFKKGFMAFSNNLAMGLYKILT